MRHFAIFLFVLLVSAASAFAQESVAPGTVPKWLRAQIHQYETGQGYEAAQQIWKITHKGHPAYYMIAPCCDQYNTLLSSKGKRLCHPTGGLTGHGDGRCPHPADNGTKVLLVWPPATPSNQAALQVPRLGQDRELSQSSSGN